MSVNPVPDGYRSITPMFVCDDARAIISFIQNAFGGVVRELSEGPGGTVMHAALQIGDSMLMLGQSNAQYPATPSLLYLYGPDVDGRYASALAADGVSIQPPTDQPYGDRNAAVRDSSGNQWWIAAHIEDVSAEEIQRRYAELAAKRQSAQG